ncbi:MAG TPA: accessory Sec system translocase SecA2 [Candidatus Angelobacter sp.]|jgi:preprotein translocase subunit SecA|nr:accessory Sec system translocase SecA2 [Candidatus Angelobacter sp.]
MMGKLLRALFGSAKSIQPMIEQINSSRRELEKLTDKELRSRSQDIQSSTDRLETIAVAVEVAFRVLGLRMFDVQIQGTLALTEGRIAEMQTGEGKTLAAVPAAVWYAKQDKGVHVLTVNDYLARRDAQWMGGIYDWFGLTVGYIQRDMNADSRKAAYACDITYATANEVGFDYLRDQLALHPSEQVHRPFAVAVIDEVDSILIDEARIPLVIAGGDSQAQTLPYRVDKLTRHFVRGTHYSIDEFGRNVSLTDAGIAAVEREFKCGNLFAPENLTLHTAAQDSIHAHALLRRDVDYLVKDGVIASVDEFKGRIIEDRRWPAGLHTAVEAKEGLALKKEGRILGSITLENLIAMYPRVCGMTGTAATQASDFSSIYGMDVEVIPTNRPVIRVDDPDKIFQARREKEEAVIQEIRETHTTGRPVLVGTCSVEESERLSVQLQACGIPHQVLNARNEEREASIVAKAGQPGAVTISTNMAGRGTDIKLGEGVAELGGLYVIGTNRHEARRIDNQLRGRAGRQGDPGRSCFLISLEDDLLVRNRAEDPRIHQSPEEIQRAVEGQNLSLRLFLHKYESVIEGQRQAIHRKRQELLTGAQPCSSEIERLVRLTTIDDLWADYLAEINELRAGIHWVTWGNRDPLFEYLTSVDKLFRQLEVDIEEETLKRLEKAGTNGFDASQRGATWTYLTTDQPFGNASERILRSLLKSKLKVPVYGR